MPYALIGIMGLLSLLSVKVPDGMSPWFFYGTSTLAALVLTGLIVLVLTAKNIEKVVYVIGFVGVGLLLTLAISIMPTH